MGLMPAVRLADGRAQFGRNVRFWGRLPPFVSPFLIATELYSDGLGDGSQRSVAAGQLLMIFEITVDAQVSEALKESRYYDVIVIGAGLRTLPPMAEQFERLIKLTCYMKRPPQAKLAFNSQRADSDKVTSWH
jgi:hypothetical protein